MSMSGPVENRDLPSAYDHTLSILALAADHLETQEWAVDRAAYALNDSVLLALREGVDAETVARVAGLTLEEVSRIACEGHLG